MFLAIVDEDRVVLEDHVVAKMLNKQCGSLLVSGRNVQQVSSVL